MLPLLLVLLRELRGLHLGGVGVEAVDPERVVRRERLARITARSRVKEEKIGSHGRPTRDRDADGLEPIDIGLPILAAGRREKHAVGRVADASSHLHRERSPDHRIGTTERDGRDLVDGVPLCQLDVVEGKIGVLHRRLGAGAGLPTVERDAVRVGDRRVRGDRRRKVNERLLRVAGADRPDPVETVLVVESGAEADAGGRREHVDLHPCVGDRGGVGDDVLRVLGVDREGRSGIDEELVGGVTGYREQLPAFERFGMAQ